MDPEAHWRIGHAHPSIVAHNLPASLNGQTIKLRLRMGTDEAVAAPGVHIDGFVITGATCP